MVKRSDTLIRDAQRGAPVRIDGVTYWAGEDLRVGQYVEVGPDNLVRAAIDPKSHPDQATPIPPSTLTFTDDYVDETVRILAALDFAAIETMAAHLALAKTIYIVGLGGSAATASHAANDLRKLCGKNAICPTDNTSLMTALANDNSFDEWLVDWLELQEPCWDEEIILFLSVGGGSGKTSRALVRAAQTCRTLEGRIPVLAIVGRDGGELARLADCAIVIPNLFPERVTPHVEGLASVLLHLLVSHPALAKNPPTWRT